MYMLSIKELAEKFLNNEDTVVMIKKFNSKQLSDIYVYDQLMRWWFGSPFGSMRRELIETTRMKRLNNECSDYDELVRRWRGSLSGSEPEKQVEDRMKKLVTKKDESFLKEALRKRNDYLCFLKDKLIEVARSLSKN